MLSGTKKMLRKKIVHSFSYLLWNFFAYLHLTLSVVLRVFPFLSKKLGTKFSERVQFELKNKVEIGCHSFFLENHEAILCFQVASEGEFEQVRWLIEQQLQKSKKIEIIFTSSSVEHRITKLYQAYPSQIRYLRTPLATLSTKDLSHWITSKVIILVRYDFYPMILSLSRSKKLVLLWFFRPRDRKGILNSLKWDLILPLFKYVVASNPDDWWWLQSKLDHHKLMSTSLDLRIMSIFDRLDNRANVLNKIFPGFENTIKPCLENNGVAILHGNAYLSELRYLSDVNWKNAINSKNIVIAVVAHHPDSIMSKFIEDAYQLNCYEITIDMSRDEISDIIQKWDKEPGVILFNGKGFLLELYSYFHVVLVGGGFKKDTHSILEPYLSGATVYCGPKINRSSEYFQVKDFDGQKLYSLATIEQWKSEGLNKILSIKVKAQNELTESKLSMLRDTVKMNAKNLFVYLGIE